MEWYKNREFELARLVRTIDELEESFRVDLVQDKKEASKISKEELTELSELDKQMLDEDSTLENKIKNEQYFVEDAMLKRLLNSFEKDEIILGLKYITSENFMQILPLLFGVFLINRDSSIRKKALNILEKYETKTSQAILKICQNRRYLSMKNEEQIKKDFKKMEKVEGFNIDTLGKYIAWRHPFSLGNYRFITQDTDEIEAFILEHLNKQKVTLTEPISPRFLKAKKIEYLTVPESSKTLWQMKQLKYLEFKAVGKKILIPKELSHLNQLKELYIYAKDITIGGSSESLELLNIQGCTNLLFDKDVLFENVKKINFISSNDTLNINIPLLRKSIPNLETIEGGSLFDNAGFMRRYKDELLMAFPNIELINLEPTYNEYIFVGSETYVVKRK